jgi:hypothetical protein
MLSSQSEKSKIGVWHICCFSTSFVSSFLLSLSSCPIAVFSSLFESNCMSIKNSDLMLCQFVSFYIAD